MQTAIQTIMEKNDQVTPLIPATDRGRQTFDLPGLITDFRDWYKNCLAERNLQLSLSVSPDIPRYAQGNQLLMKHLLFEVGKSSLLYAGAGDVGVQFEVRQRTSRRHSLTLTISLAGATIPATRVKEMFQACSIKEQRDPCRFRSANLYYAQMIAARFGGDIQIDNSTASGVRYLVGINIFTRPS